MNEPSFVPSPAALPSDPGADPWAGLRRFTPARIALGRAGGSQPTRAVLDFRLAHARARDAVQAPFNPTLVTTQLTKANLTSLVLETGAADRRSYLLRPDLGRTLTAESRTQLAAVGRPQSGRWDLCVIISDGLAAAAAERHAAATLLPLATELGHADWQISPVLVIPLARVKIQDEVGTILGARYTLILLGERPGLGVPDSLGAYFTAEPAVDRTDADRNCVSNIRPEGIPPAAAAAKLAWLLQEAARTGLSGVRLKDNQPSPSLPG